jgi:amidase
MAATGALTRGVLDTARFLDAVTGDGTAHADGASRPPGTLRIAVSAKIPRGIIAAVDAEPRAALDRTAERLRELGHTVVERDPDYGNAGVNVLTRYLRGVADDAADMPHPERLARWTRGIAALGGRIPERIVRRAHAQEAADRDRTNRVLEECDVLMTPALTRRPPPLGEWLGLPAPLLVNGMAAFTAHLAIWNHTGQPAASVPVETAPDGFPVAVQLVGRPGAEATLLALAGQLQTATGWLERRPPIAA